MQKVYSGNATDFTWGRKVGLFSMNLAIFEGNVFLVQWKKNAFLNLLIQWHSCVVSDANK